MLEVGMLIQFAIQFNICEQVHSKNRIDEDYQQNQTSYVDQGWQRQQECYKCTFQCFVPLEKIKHPGYPERPYDSSLWTKLKVRTLLHYDSDDCEYYDNHIERVP